MTVSDRIWIVVAIIAVALLGVTVGLISGPWPRDAGEISATAL